MVVLKKGKNKKLGSIRRTTFENVQTFAKYLKSSKQISFIVI